MKTFSKEKLILEHYVKAAEEVMDEVTVRVWKPKTMQKLPAVCMRGVMQSHRRSALSARDIYWGTGNPDYGYWDAQIVYCANRLQMTVDIYICALLIRPYSEEAFNHYDERMGLEVWKRLLLMWDSRNFDAEGGYKPSAYGDLPKGEGSLTYEQVLRVMNEWDDIEDTSK